MKPCTFKIGDKVRCIDGRGSGNLTVGKIYTVKRFDPLVRNERVLVYVMGDGGYEAASYHYRFELVEEKPAFQAHPYFKLTTSELKDIILNAEETMENRRKALFILSLHESFYKFFYGPY